MSCTVCHKEDTDGWNPEVGGAMRQDGVCDCV